MYRICKAIIAAYIDTIRMLFFRIYLRGEDMISEKTIRYSRFYSEESTAEIESEESFNFWLLRVCRDEKRNDPIIDAVEIDHRGE